MSDTDTFNRVAGMDRAWTDRMTSEGQTERVAVMRSMGITTTVEELSFDVEAPHRFRIVRRFLSGLVSWNVVELELTAAGSHTHLVYTVHLWPRSVLLLPVVSVVSWRTRHDLAAAFATYAEQIAKDRAPTSLLAAPRPAVPERRWLRLRPRCRRQNSAWPWKHSSERRPTIC